MMGPVPLDCLFFLLSAFQEQHHTKCLCSLGFYSVPVLQQVNSCVILLICAWISKKAMIENLMQVENVLNIWLLKPSDIFLYGLFIWGLSGCTVWTENITVLQVMWWKGMAMEITFFVSFPR